MLYYNEERKVYMKTEGEPLKQGDFVTLHTGEHMLERAPQERIMEGHIVRVWIIEVRPGAYIPITEILLDSPVEDTRSHTLH